MKNRHRQEQIIREPETRVCLDCGEDIPLTETAFYWETSDDQRFWLHAPPTEGPVCESCWVTRDNREPPEPDGEAFRGGEAAAFRAEEQARIQRDLK